MTEPMTIRHATDVNRVSVLELAAPAVVALRWAARSRLRRRVVSLRERAGAVA